VVKAEIGKSRKSNIEFRTSKIADRCLWIEYQKNGKPIVTENTSSVKSVTNVVCGFMVYGFGLAYRENSYRKVVKAEIGNGE